MASVERDKRGSFFSEKKKRSYSKTNVLIHHNFGVGHTCNVSKCLSNECPLSNNYNFGKNVSREGWKTGRRIVELEVLLRSLQSCKAFRLGPVPLTYDSVVVELQRGLWGYLYVKCSNIECAEINIIPYGKTHRTPGSKGIPSFAVNTKLGTGKLLFFVLRNKK